MGNTSSLVQPAQLSWDVSFFMHRSDEVTLRTFGLGGQDLVWPYHGRRASFDELEDAVELLRDSVPASCRFAEDFRVLDKGLRLQALRKVAVAGSALFKTILQDVRDRAEFRKLVAGSDGADLMASGDASVVPWEAMCLAENPEEATVKDFLGWKYRHSRVAPQHGRLRSRSPEATTHTRTGLIEDNRLDTVRLGVNRSRNPLVAGGRFTPAPVVFPGKGFRKLQRFMANVKKDTAFGVFHFDCHLDHKPRPSGIRNSSFGVRKGYGIRYDVLDRMPIYNGPFLFFNVCNGGSVEFGTATSYAGQLVEQGADCVISAEAKVGDDFAADFAGRVYRHAIAGASIGEALFAARRDVLAESMNPFALFFSIYGLPHMRLLPSLDIAITPVANGVAV